jgi:hypothetical protein
MSKINVNIPLTLKHIIILIDEILNSPWVYILSIKNEKEIIALSSVSIAKRLSLGDSIIISTTKLGSEDVFNSDETRVVTLSSISDSLSSACESGLSRDVALLFYEPKKFKVTKELVCHIVLTSLRIH